MNHKEYNGWWNYETWLYGVWNDGDYNAEIAQEIWDDAEAEQYFTREERARLDLAARLESDFAELNELPDTGLVADLVNAAVSEINWHEIAEHLLAEVDKGEETAVAS